MNEQVDLNEGDEVDEDEESLGEDAVDLATMLDDDVDRKSRETNGKPKIASASVEEQSDGEGFSENSDVDAAEDDGTDTDPSKISQLNRLISSLHQEETEPKEPWALEAHESMEPSDVNLRLEVDPAKLMSRTTDAAEKRALKLLRDDTKSSKRNGIPKKLVAPLAKRQRDQLERKAANKRANDTLGRWVDTVKQHRRAEHLHFPVEYPGEKGTYGEHRLLPTTTATATNNLESTIQSILQESGLSSQRAGEDEDKLRKWEELQTNKLPLEEVLARRADLRQQRDLLFREEVRAKRIKKIKSKTYRRVHRKERQRQSQRERDALAADGVDVSEDEREYNDRRRAEERMGAKHKDSRWSKSVKASKRSKWDEDARTSVMEKARRHEELMRRIQGQEIQKEDNDSSDITSDEEDDDEDGDGEQVRAKSLQRQLGRLDQPKRLSDRSTKLASMPFMQKADVAKKARNDEDIERMRRELAGEESRSDDSDANAARTGRKKYGPTRKQAARLTAGKRSEFEERAGSDDDRDSEADLVEKPTDSKFGKSTRAVIKANAFQAAPSLAGADTNRSLSTKGPNNQSSQIFGASSSGNNTVVAGKSITQTSRNIISQASKSALPRTDIDIGTDNPFLAETLSNKKTGQPPTPLVLGKSGSSQDQPKASSKLVPQATSKSKSRQTSEKASAPRISAPDADGWQTVTYGCDDDDASERASDEGHGLPFVTRNQELTAKAFAGDDVENEFATEKRATVAEEGDHVVDETLPGWGSWVGEGLSKAAQRRNRGKVLVKHEGVAPEQRQDAKLERVIINEKRAERNTKYMASSLPFPFESREQYERSLRMPKGPEWTTRRTFHTATVPRVVVKQGIIRPLDKPLV